MLRIYIAGRFEARERLRQERTALEALGHKVTSTWLDEEPEQAEIIKQDFGKKNSSGLGAEYARRDIRDLHQSNTIILDTFDEDDRGGREVEWGYMISMRDSSRRFLGQGCYNLYLVGPKRNIFHELADKHFGNWAKCLQFLQENPQ